MGIIEIILLFGLGFSVALPASMAGVGGGFLIMPSLIIFFGLPTQNAIAISLAAITGTTISCTIIYLRQRKVDFFLALLYDLFDIPGVIIGAYFASLIRSDLLAGIVGIFIMSLSILLIIRKKNIVTDQKYCDDDNSNSKTSWSRKTIFSDGKTFSYIIRRPFLVFLSSFAGGLATGLAGLGGGITDTSTMILLGIPTQIAVASSQFAMSLTNGVGLITHGLLANLLLEYAVPLTFGTIIGAQVGAFLCKYVDGATLRKILIILAFVAGVRLLTHALNIF